MEELNNQTIDNTNMEVVESVEILVNDNNEDEDLGQTNNTAIVAVALATVIGAGIYGVKKFINWRKAKKEAKETIHTVESIIEDVETEIDETENDI